MPNNTICPTITGGIFITHLPTYRVKVRGTKSSWLTLIDKGEVTALKSPEIRALASRYGNPDEVLSDDWAPYIPGINAPGKFQRLRQGSMENLRCGDEEDRRGDV